MSYVSVVAIDKQGDGEVCCQCYQLDFVEVLTGKFMSVQVTNTGLDLIREDIILMSKCQVEVPIFLIMNVPPSMVKTKFTTRENDIEISLMK